MASDQDPESSSNDKGFGELVRRIKIGDQAATGNLRSLFGEGIEFLLRRRLGKIHVSVEVATVIEGTLRAIQTNKSSESLNLQDLIVNIIHAQFPSSVTTVESARADSPACKMAQSVLAGMSALERDILRLYYELGVTPDAIQARLRVGSQTIRDTLAKARSRFFRKTAGP